MENNSKLLYEKAGEIIPVILDDQYNIVNGNARFQYYSKKFKQVPATIVPAANREVFRIATAKYSFNGKQDNIRTEQRRHYVQYGRAGVYKEALLGKRLCNASSTLIDKYMLRHYKRILDFGSGNGKQTITQRAGSYDITLFEPFATGDKAGLSIKQTYEILDKALDSIAKPEPFDLVVANAVINSVPFEDDLRKVVVLLKFLSTGAKTLIVSSRNLTDYGKAKSIHTATKVADLRRGIL